MTNRNIFRARKDSRKESITFTGEQVKPYIPLATGFTRKFTSRVKKGFAGKKGWRYHPTKGFKRSAGFSPKEELEYRKGKRSELEKLIRAPNGAI